jgi:hypothetical protein
VTVAQQPANVLVEMVRGAIITGKILDPQGRPLIRAEVHALRPDGVQRVAVRQTNDEGEYRMFWVPPGEFVIRVNPVVVPANLASVSPGPMISVPTFFPGTPDVAQATKISVKSGDEIRNINFAARTDVVLRPTPPPPGSPLAAAAAAGPGVKVSGQIMNALMPATGMAALVIGSEADPAQPRQVGQVNVNAATVPFEIPSVPPGKYDLLVRMNDPRGSLGTGGATQAWGRTTLEVRDRDIDGVRLTIHASFDVPGTITIDGKPPMDGGNLKVGLVPMGTVSRIANYRGITNRDQTPGDGGKFAIQSAAEGNYEVVVKGLPVGGYIADVRQGDTSVLADGVSVRDVPPAAFQVLVSTDGGSVEGIAVDVNKTPVSGATVVLAPEDRRLWSLLKIVTAGADGKYVIRGLRPGAYKLLSANLPVPANGVTADAFSRYESKSVSVIVKASETANADTVVVTDP